MRILVFLHGTTIMHKNAVGHTREEIVKQVIEGKSIHDCASHVPVGKAVEKLHTWKNQGAEILYLSPHNDPEDIEKEKSVLKKYNFPKGELFYCKKGEDWDSVTERANPDILIEDDCESIGGEPEMAYPNLNPELKEKIKSIVIKEFGGIDHLPDDIEELIK